MYFGFILRAAGSGRFCRGGFIPVSVPERKPVPPLSSRAYHSARSEPCAKSNP